MEEKNSETLPYGLAVENVFLVLDELKKRPSISDDELELRIGKTYQKAKNAATELKIITIENNQPVLSSTGKHIAWEINEMDRKKLILSCIIQRFRPYEIALSRMVRDEREVIPTEFVQQIWAREMNFKLSEENLARAVAFFFQLLALTGVGDIYIGRHGQKTRFSFKVGAKDFVNNNCQETPKPQGTYNPEEFPHVKDIPKTTEATNRAESVATVKSTLTSNQDIDECAREKRFQDAPQGSSSSSTPNIPKGCSYLYHPELPAPIVINSTRTFKAAKIFWEAIDEEWTRKIESNKAEAQAKQSAEIQPQVSDIKLDVTPSE